MNSVEQDWHGLREGCGCTLGGHQTGVIVWKEWPQALFQADRCEHEKGAALGQADRCEHEKGAATGQADRCEHQKGAATGQQCGEHAPALFLGASRCAGWSAATVLLSLQARPVSSQKSCAVHPEKLLLLGESQFGTSHQD
eukprot:1144705-Pelagomonas_calceolata.AAC.2